MTIDAYQKDASQYLMNTYARYPITLIKGEGAYVWDSRGKKYLDFLSGIGCTSLGHCHPVIEAAILEQMQTILHTSNLFFSPPNIELAKYLVEQGGLDKVFFCNSGAEANETAIKLARKYQWQKGYKNKNLILSAMHSFHGRTLGALAATAKPALHQGFGPMPNGFEYHDWEDEKGFCNAIHENVAAVIIEPIQGEGGIRVVSSDFLRRIRSQCNNVGAVLIFDEVQCGIGRTGELFAYQFSGVKPDVITLAKGIANGLPLGAVCASLEVADAFKPRDHGTTFGGNPVCSAAALANLSTIIDQQYLPKIKKLGLYLKSRLQDLQDQYPSHIKAIRGTGLMLGIELSQHPKEILSNCQNLGLIVNITAENVLRLLPPYVITESDIDFAIDVIAESFKI
jgi:predicted acetylornithine/succinylornithine family transaminase